MPYHPKHGIPAHPQAQQVTTLAEVFRNERAARPARAPRIPLTVRAARWLARRLPAWNALRTLLLSVAGFALITAAAWMLHVAAGLAVGGVSLLVLEALSGGDRR